MQNKINEIISAISNKDQMTEKEYRYITDLSSGKKMLIFGCGKDSNLWRIVADKVLFLEHNKKWIDKKYNDTIHIQYSSSIKNTDILLEKFKQNQCDDLYIQSLINNESVSKTSWDTILVDAPEGWNENKHHGRVQSIFMAKFLAHIHTNIFVHDINRTIEKKCCEVLGFKQVNEFDRLGHYIL